MAAAAPKSLDYLRRMGRRRHSLSRSLGNSFAPSLAREYEEDLEEVERKLSSVADEEEGDDDEEECGHRVVPPLHLSAAHFAFRKDSSMSSILGGRIPKGPSINDVQNFFEFLGHPPPSSAFGTDLCY